MIDTAIGSQRFSWRKALFLSANSRWIAASLIVKLVLMPLTWHNDAVWMPWMAYKILDGHLNVYQYLFDTFGSKTLTPVVWAPYLPLYYYIEASWLFIIRQLGLTDIGLWYFDNTRWFIDNLNLSLLFVKAIYIPFDIGTGYFLSKLVSPSRRRLVWAFWLFSPASLLVAFLMGQNDLMPTFLVIAAVYFGEKTLARNQRGLPDLGSATSAMILLGLGGGIKTYPLLLLLPFAMVLGKTKTRTIFFGAVGLAPFLIMIAPFLRTKAFIEGSLLNPEGQGLLNMALNNGGNTAYVFVIAYAAMLVYLGYRRTVFTPKSIRIITLTVLTMVFVIGPWPFNWYVWLAPFTILVIAEMGHLFPLYLIQTAHFLFWTLSWGNLIGAGLFTPVYASSAQFASLKDVISKAYPYQRLESISYSVFVTVSLAILLLYLRIDIIEQAFGVSIPREGNVVEEHISTTSALIPFGMLLILFIAAFASGIVLKQHV